MEFIVVVITLVLLAILLNINYKKIKKLSNDNSLDYITKKLPTNKEICKKILELLGKNVKIEEEPEFKNSLYIALTDKIIIGKMKIDSLRVQTIAHECIHSTQNKKIQFANFFLTNIYNLYFIVSLILTIFNIFKNVYLNLYILTMLGLACICIRNYLETDAMSKAEFIAEKYLNTTDIPKEEQKTLINQYKDINSVGIPLVNYINVLKEMLKPLIYTIFI